MDAVRRAQARERLARFEPTLRAMGEVATDAELDEKLARVDRALESSSSDVLRVFEETEDLLEVARGRTSVFVFRGARRLRDHLAARVEAVMA
jgi:hypothetical protein